MNNNVPKTMDAMNTRISTKCLGQIRILMMNYAITGFVQKNSNQKWKDYTDEQVKQIREYLYQLAKFDIENFKNLSAKKNEGN